ncbi:MAG TPA: carboxypeptidase regulatory-like domain-containing protein [Rubricoccaceae bacterium]|jgi:hypothetical protein
MRLRFPRGLSVLLALITLAGCKEGTLLPDQFGGIEGTVVDFTTGVPIAGAGVTTSPATNATVTGGDGRFSVPDALVGSYTITANRNGYTPNTATVSVREGRTAQATVFLRPSTDPNTGGTPTLDLTAEVTNFFNRRVSTPRGDSVVVVIDYRVRNTGTAVIPSYQVVFRIVTPAGDFFQEVTRTTLAVGQSAVGRVEKDTGGAQATEVRVDEFFINDQPRPAGPRGRPRAS